MKKIFTNSSLENDVFLNTDMIKTLGNSSIVLPISKQYTQRKKLAHPATLPSEQLKLYQKYSHLKSKQHFRKQLAEVLGEDFLHLANYLRKDGVILFREFVDKSVFANLVDSYEIKLEQCSRSQMGHYFFDFRDEVDFLTSPSFKSAFLHPLLLSLISYEFGGPVRLVDVRGKDTEPTLNTDRDNGLHIDDSIYAQEYKFLLVWEQGKFSGPKGQNFIALPGTHELIRVVSSEHGANFRTPLEITSEILQHPVLKERVFVMEAEDEEPLTIVFEATALAHQRFRTNEKASTRSCLIFAFHVDDESNSPVSYLSDLPNSLNELEQFVLGKIDNKRQDATAKADYFLKLIAAQKHTISVKLLDIKNNKKFIPAEEKRLSKKAVDTWLHTIGKTPQMEERKPRLPKTNMQKEIFIKYLLDISEYDKHADLDLELYPDRRELPRKAVRTRIREKCLTEQAKSRIIQRFYEPVSLNPKLMLSTTDLMNLSYKLCDVIHQLSLTNSLSQELQNEFMAIKQLAFDIGDAFQRCSTVQVLRSQSIFLYWVFDELWQLLDVQLIGEKYKLLIDSKAKILLKHYATLVAIDDYQYQTHLDAKDLEDRHALSE